MASFLSWGRGRPQRRGCSAIQGCPQCRGCHEPKINQVVKILLFQSEVI